MRCSLLALSSYIDAELDAEPTGELEAHLVACDRCRTAVGHLQEESARIAGLARVHVPDDAVRELFSQIGLMAEEDDLPEGPVRRDRPEAVEAPPWFGAERGAALPWAPRPSAHDHSQPRELVGERAPTIAIADPPELFLWDESIDQIATAVPEPPAVHVLAAEPELEPAPEEESAVQPVVEIRDEPVAAAPRPVMDTRDEPVATQPEPAYRVQAWPVAMDQPPPTITPAPQPPDLSTSAPMVAPPRLAAGSNALQRLRDAVAVRFALRRGAGSQLDPDVEIVSGIGAPRWNERAHRSHWSDSPPIVAAAAPALAEPSPPPVVKPRRARRFLARLTAEPALDAPATDVESVEADLSASDAAPETVAAAAAPALADVLSEVASLAAPLERTHTPAPDDAPPAQAEPGHAPGRRAPASDIDATDSPDDDMQFGVDAEPASSPVPGRHVRRLHSQKSDRRQWTPTQPVTGRHVLPLGGPAVGAADRDRRLWLFGAVTVVLMLLGLLVGRQVTQTGPLVASTLPRSTPAGHATTPPTAAPLPIATAAPAPTAVVPSAPTPQQLTGAKTLGSGSSGFSVADVRYGEHPNDFRLVFDMAFPSTVTGSPSTVIGYDGPTTIYVEFTGVLGATNIATMPHGQVVTSVVALLMARNTNRLIFKITLSKNAPFDAYYLSGARLVIDIT
ncbi:MAG: zf-HC2 domain-containing protein [Candidatus Dormibacteria bacterium]